MADVQYIQHGSVNYTVIALESCLKLATDLQHAGKRWHSHVLSPGCCHNPFLEQYAIVVEDDVDHRAYIATSSGFPEVDKALVKLLHGDDILDASKTAAARGANPVRSSMLDRLRDIDGRRVAWHHHMNFPGCTFNPQPGKWAITIESTEGDFFETYENEPVDVLREVEVLYFSNLEGQR